MTAEVSHRGCGAGENRRAQTATLRFGDRGLNTATGSLQSTARQSALRLACPGRPAGGLSSLRGRPWGRLSATLAHPIRIFFLHTVPTHRDAAYKERPPPLPGRRNLAIVERRLPHAPLVFDAGIVGLAKIRNLRPLATVVKVVRTRVSRATLGA